MPWYDAIKPMYIAQFFEGLPRRLPSPTGDTAEVYGRIANETAALHAAMLRRDHDPRVSVDVAALSRQIADRAGRFTSDDWQRDNVLERAREAVARISAEVRGDDTAADPDDPWGDDTEE